MRLSPGAIVLLITVAPYLLLSAFVAWQARQRGYSFAVWFVANVVSLNPILILMVLTMLPDARKVALRRQEGEALEARLATRPSRTVPATGAPVASGSLGDQSTEAPSPSRSVGDEETRL